MEKTVVLGMMEEIRMKASILRKKLKDNPQNLSEIIEKTKVLEEEMILCLSELVDQNNET